MRAAAYSGTRNVYEDMLIAAKSLLEHSNIEEIYFLIEDDTFPYDLPPEIKCINISNQTYFPLDGPNFRNFLTYMVLIRVAYPKLFPNLDRILTIDIDTIVNENISSLWDLNLDDYYLAAVEETENPILYKGYINMGVAMLNLKKMREDHKDDEMIEALNTFWYRFNEQDCINEYCRDKILYLPNDYNACWQTGMPKHEKITHFAGIYNLKKFPHFDYYKNLPIDKIERNKPDKKITLDIIIPTYNNKKELIRTLNSIPSHSDINVIVVDDGSNLDYTDILKQYPSLIFYQLNKNVGPGMARQYGMEHSSGTYIMFLDAGDYFYDKGLEEIMRQINENTYIKMYSWSYVQDKDNHLMDKLDDKTIGKVYKRSFIEMYGICFSEEGSYADEDFGFIHACKIILKIMRDYKFASMIKHIKIPILYEHYDKNSITKANNEEFFYTKLIKGIAINSLHALNVVKKFAAAWYFQLELSDVLALEYYFFLCIAYERPELLDDVWPVLRDYYFKGYRIYKKYSSEHLANSCSQITVPAVKKRSEKWKGRISINIEQFVKELETEEFTPVRYFSIGE